MNSASGQESFGHSFSGTKILDWTAGEENVQAHQLIRHNEDIVHFKWR